VHTKDPNRNVTGENPVNVYQKLESLGIALSEPTIPAASYVPFVRSGNLVFLSGHLAKKNAKIWVGILGDGVTTAQGAQAARAIAVDLLGTMHKAIGDLNSLSRIVKLTSMVNSTSEFSEQHLVANGASELLVEVFGDKGLHARSAFGVAQLPLGACVEIELIVEARPV
jgi:enamine deaminase RidA (YjgF/YER057c/UK114 family)